MKKENIKIYTKMAIILASIAGVCGLLIGALNEVTNPIIIKNKLESEDKALKQICPNGIFEKEKLNKEYQYIVSIYDVINVNDGSKIYTLSGKNAYGQIDLMVGIRLESTIFKIVTMTNTESYGSTVDEFIDNYLDKIPVNNDYYENLLLIFIYSTLIYKI